MTKPLAACPDCGHDWDRHTGSCHYIGDCSGRECGCQRRPKLAAPLSQPMDADKAFVLERVEWCDCLAPPIYVKPGTIPKRPDYTVVSHALGCDIATGKTEAEAWANARAIIEAKENVNE